VFLSFARFLFWFCEFEKIKLFHPKKITFFNTSPTKGLMVHLSGVGC
jgi:hypothetical protein